MRRAEILAADRPQQTVGLVGRGGEEKGDLPLEELPYVYTYTRGLYIFRKRVSSNF